MSEARVVAVFVGGAREVAGDPPTRTAYLKSRAVGPVVARREGLDGDEQVSRIVHGGPDRAVLAFARAHYDALRAAHPGAALPPGTFAENLLLDGVDEHDVCVGDRVRVGAAVLEVTMPRTPCGMISRATGVTGLFETVRASGRGGWLLRVIDEGSVAEGDVYARLARPSPTWSIARAVDVMSRVKSGDATAVPDALALAAVPSLAAQWRDKLVERASGLTAT